MIEICRISKTYPNGVRANRDVSFRVPDGEILGLVGANGSGKTTLVQQILGVLRSDSGSIKIDGVERDTGAIAYVPQFPALYPALSIRETVTAGLLYSGFHRRDALAAADATLRRVRLDGKAGQYAYTLSGGQKKLLSFACALALGKKNLILDEVTSMVDVLTKEIVWELIEEERARGAAILLTSHDISEVKRLCASVAVMKKGEITFCGRAESLPADACHCTLSADDPETAASILERCGCRASRDGARIDVVTETLPDMLEALRAVSAATTIQKLECEHPSFYEGMLSLLRGEGART